MRKIAIQLVLFALLSLQLYGQPNDLNTFVFSRVRRIIADTEKIVYTDRIGEWAYKDAVKSAGEELKAYNGGDMKTERLTKSEIDYVLKKLKESARQRWKDHLFPNSKMINLDSINEYFRTRKDAKRNAFNLLETPQYSTEFRKAIIKELSRKDWVFVFSRPIYLRNNTLAVHFYMETCGLDCGFHELAVYRKVNGSWEQWRYISAGNW